MFIQTGRVVFHTLLECMFTMRTHSTLQWHKHQLVLVYMYVSALQVGHTLNSLCSVAVQPAAANVIILTSADPRTLQHIHV